MQCNSKLGVSPVHYRFVQDLYITAHCSVGTNECLYSQSHIRLVTSSVVEIISDRTPPLMLGQQLVLTCSVSGVELLELEWLVGRSKYPDKDNVHTNLTSRMSSLTIHSLSSSDAGVYECKVAYQGQGNHSIKNTSDKITITAKSKYALMSIQVIV